MISYIVLFLLVFYYINLIMVSNNLDYEIIKKIFKNDITKYNIDKEHIIQSILKIKYLPNVLLKEICVYDIDF